MPVRLDTQALLRVSGQAERGVRSEALAAGTNLHGRLALAHENYARQGGRGGRAPSGPMGVHGNEGRGSSLIAIRDVASVSGATYATRGVS